MTESATYHSPPVFLTCKETALKTAVFEQIPHRLAALEADIKELKARPEAEAPHVFHALVSLAHAAGFDFSKLETLYDQLQALYALKNGPRIPRGPSPLAAFALSMQLPNVLMEQLERANTAPKRPEPDLRTFDDPQPAPAADKPKPEPSDKPETHSREKIAQARCDLFNSLYPVGACLFVRFEKHEPMIETTANSPAYVDNTPHCYPRAVVAINHPNRCDWVTLPLSHVYGHDI